jgi:hypothetical protein
VVSPQSNPFLFFFSYVYILRDFSGGTLCSFKAAGNFSKQDKGASLSERKGRVLAPPVFKNSQGKPKAFKASKKFFAYFLTREKPVLNLIGDRSP